LRGEYRYVALGAATTVDPVNGLIWNNDVSEHVARIVATYRLGRPGAGAPVSTPRTPTPTWSGFYAGVGLGGDAITSHVNGGLFGGLVDLDYSGLGGVDAGATAMVGYDRQVFTNWVVGAFALFDLGTNGASRFAIAPGTPIGVSTDLPAIERSWTAGVRAGYLLTPDALAYWLAGYTETSFHPVSYNLGVGVAAGTGTTPVFHGLTLGGGFEKLFAPYLSARAEYRHTQLGTVSNLLAPGFTTLTVDGTVHTVRLVLSYRLASQ
jgi:outer membrane immunogenic protein